MKRVLYDALVALTLATHCVFLTQVEKERIAEVIKALQRAITMGEPN